MLGRGGEKVALGAESAAHGGDHFFPNRVEWWIGDLRELLSEVVEDEARPIRNRSDRGVRAHGTEWLCASLAHRSQQDADFFFCVTECSLATHDRGRSVRNVLPLGELLELNPVLSNPLSPRLLVSQLLLELLILNETTFDRVSQEHGARTQTALPHHSRRVDVENANLTREDDQTIRGDDVTPWTQPVTVKSGSDERPVGEYESGRAIPGLHQHRVILVKGPDRLVHVYLVFPCFRNHHHDGVWQRTPGKGQKLNNLIKGCGVTSPVGHDREQWREVA